MSAKNVELNSISGEIDVMAAVSFVLLHVARLT